MFRRRFLVASITAIALMVPFGGTAFAAASDERETAVEIPSLPYSDPSTNTTASTAADDPYPRCGNNSRSKSVWYRFTPNEAMNLDAHVASASFYYPMLSVWVEEGGSLVPVACSSYTSRTFIEAQAGTTYWFMITSATTQSGTFTFSLQEAPDQIQLSVAAEDKGWVSAASGNVTVTGEIACSRPATSIYLQVTVSQGDHDRTGYAYVNCEQNDLWSVIVRGDFKNGKADVDSQVRYNDTDTGQTSEASDNVVAELRTCTKIGTLGNDTMRGTSRADSLCSLAGDDTIYGGGGNDKLRGHDGNDVLHGGAGNDLLTGGFGDDRLNGNGGSDTLYGDAGADLLNGGKGSDRCRGSEGNNTLRSCERRF